MPSYAPVLHSRAEVPTPRGERWRKQLASHLGRKATVREEGDVVVVVLPVGSCAMTCDAEALRLAATGPDEESLTRVEDVVGVHLERMAAKEGLRVVWHRQP